MQEALATIKVDVKGVPKIKKTGQEFKKASKDVGAFGKAKDKARTSSKRLGQQVKKTGKNVGGFGKAADKAQVSSKKLGGRLDRVRRSAKKTRAGFKKLGKSTKTLGGSFDKLGATIKKHPLLAGAGIAVAIGGSIKAFSDYEMGLARMATLTNETDFVFGEFSDTVVGLSRKFGIARKEFTDSGFDMLSAGTKVSEVNERMAASASLATAGVTDLATANNALLTVLKIYGHEIKDAEDAADYLFKLQQIGRTTMGGAAKVYGMYASVAASMGVSAETTASAFSAITQASLGDEKTATQWMALLTAFSKPFSQDSIDAAAKYGVVLNSTALEGEGLLNVVSGLSAASTDEMAVIIKETLARQAMINLILFESDLREGLISMIDRSTARREGEAKMMDITHAKMARMKQDFVTFSIMGAETAESFGFFDAMSWGLEGMSNQLRGAKVGLLGVKEAALHTPGLRGLWGNEEEVARELKETTKKRRKTHEQVTGFFRLRSKPPQGVGTDKEGLTATPGSPSLTTKIAGKAAVTSTPRFTITPSMKDKIRAGFSIVEERLALEESLTAAVNERAKDEDKIAELLVGIYKIREKEKEIAEDINRINSEVILGHIDRIGTLVSAMEKVEERSTKKTKDEVRITKQILELQKDITKEKAKRGELLRGAATEQRTQGVYEINARIGRKTERLGELQGERRTAGAGKDIFPGLMQRFGKVGLGEGFTIKDALQKQSGISGFERFRVSMMERELSKPETPLAFQAGLADKVFQSRLGMFGKATTEEEASKQFQGAFGAMGRAQDLTLAAAQEEISDRKTLLGDTEKIKLTLERMERVLDKFQQNTESRNPDDLIVMSGV